MLPNKILVAADYAQLEVRVAAFVSRDPVLMEIMNADPTSFEGDLHARTMYEVFGVPFDKQGGLKHIRVQAKTYFFSVLYGGREDGAIQRIEKQALEMPELNIVVPSKLEARKRIDGIRSSYRVFFKECVPFMIYQAREENGCNAYTAFGRPRCIPELLSKVKEDREAAERQVVSHHVQGTAADIARFAMLAVERIPHGQLLIQNHDELVSEVDFRWKGWYAEAMIKAMELGQPLEGVPLVVDVGEGRTWLDTHK